MYLGDAVPKTVLALIQNIRFLLFFSTISQLGRNGKTVTKYSIHYYAAAAYPFMIVDCHRVYFH